MKMNPFILSAYHSPEYFCDRNEELRSLMNAIENNRNVVLTSLRRMGKTGLIKHLEHNLKNNSEISFVYFDIMATTSMNEFIKVMVDSFFNINNKNANSIYKKFVNIFGLFKPSFSVNHISGETKFNIELTDKKDEESSLNAMFDYISSQKKKFVIAIDEFQQIANYSENNAEQILRSKIQMLNNVVFIFSGSSRDILRSMFSNKGRPFYQSSQFLYLKSINRIEYSKFIIDKFSLYGTILSQELVDHILDLTNSHTYYVQNLCNRLYSENYDEITISRINQVFGRLVDENIYYFENIKQLLTDLQWKLLKAIAKEGKVKEINANSFLARHSLGSSSSVNTAVKSLLKKELIYKEDDHYFVYDLLFSKWLERL